MKMYAETGGELHYTMYLNPESWSDTGYLFIQCCGHFITLRSAYYREVCDDRSVAAILNTNCNMEIYNITKFVCCRL